MEPILEAVSRDPLHYLPEKSPLLLRHFLAAYVARCRAEVGHCAISSRLRAFERWLCERFSLGDASRDPFSTVSFYSDGPEDGLNRFFLLFAEFDGSGFRMPGVEGTVTHLPAGKEKKLDLVNLIREVSQAAGAVPWLSSFQLFPRVSEWSSSKRQGSWNPAE